MPGWSLEYVTFTEEDIAFRNLFWALWACSDGHHYYSMHALARFGPGVPAARSSGTQRQRTHAGHMLDRDNCRDAATGRARPQTAGLGPRGPPGAPASRFARFSPASRRATRRNTQSHHFFLVALSVEGGLG